MAHRLLDWYRVPLQITQKTPGFLRPWRHWQSCEQSLLGHKDSTGIRCLNGSWWVPLSSPHLFKWFSPSLCFPPSSSSFDLWTLCRVISPSLLQLTNTLQGLYSSSRLSNYSNVKSHFSAIVRDRTIRYLSPSSSKPPSFAPNPPPRRVFQDMDTTLISHDTIPITNLAAISLQPAIPTEVVERIIDMVAESVVGFNWNSSDVEERIHNLHACALVGRSWAPRSRIHLFRHVMLGWDRRTRQFLNSLAQHPALGQHVEILQIQPYDDDERTCGWIFKALSSLSLLLPHLRELVFCELPDLRPECITVLSRFRTVESLVLYKLMEQSLREVVLLISLFHQLRQLHVRCCEWKLPGRCYSRKQHNLTTLHVNIELHYLALCDSKFPHLKNIEFVEPRPNLHVFSRHTLPAGYSGINTVPMVCILLQLFLSHSDLLQAHIHTLLQLVLHNTADHLLSGTRMALKHWWSLSQPPFPLSSHPHPLYPWQLVYCPHWRSRPLSKLQEIQDLSRAGWIVLGVGGGDVYQAEECCSVGFMSLREWPPNVIHISFRTGKRRFRSSTPLCPLQSLLCFLLSVSMS